MRAEAQDAWIDTIERDLHAIDVGHQREMMRLIVTTGYQVLLKRYAQHPSKLQEVECAYHQLLELIDRFEGA